MNGSSKQFLPQDNEYANENSGLTIIEVFKLFELRYQLYVKLRVGLLLVVSVVDHKGAK